MNLTSDGEYVLHNRMNDWKDINESNMKIFIAHLILMGIVKEITNCQILVKKCID